MEYYSQDTFPPSHDGVVGALKLREHETRRRTDKCLDATFWVSSQQDGKPLTDNLLKKEIPDRATMELVNGSLAAEERCDFFFLEKEASNEKLKTNETECKVVYQLQFKPVCEYW